MMGELVNHFEPLKKLGCFEVSNQWILYDARFQKFFDFFSQNITEVNVLSDHEALEYEEITNLNDIDEIQQKAKLEEYAPGILQTWKSNEVTSLSTEISAYLQAEQDYIHLLELVRIGKSKANARVCELEDKNCVLMTKEKELISQCHCQSKQLETLQEDNKKLYKDTRNCFSKAQSPPLLFHQLPLEQYFMKCDSFLQYFTFYLQENYKIQEFLKFDSEENKTEELTVNLESLKNMIAEFSLKLFEEKIKAEATQSMIDELDPKQIHTVNLKDLERELYELELLTEHHLKVANDTLRCDLKAHVQHLAQQRIELVLYENTKHKLERAIRRLEKDKGLTKIAAEALSNADLIWIAIQLDLERASNIIDNDQQLKTDAQACWKRIKAMHALNTNIANKDLSGGFLEILANLLMKSSNVQCIKSEAKACLYEYEKFCRLLAYALQNMLGGRAYFTAKEQLREIKRLETMLEPLIYDSPIEAPILYNVTLQLPIYNAKIKHRRVEKDLRELRSQFQNNIVERMEKDPLWRASQLLWIWFVKQPKRLLMAMEEVKRAAANVASFSGGKPLSGIKRK